MASGSAGNSIYLETPHCGVLIDAGLSQKELAARLKLIGRDIADVDAVFLTHEHSDHVKGLAPLARKTNIRMYATEGTYKALKREAEELPGSWHFFKPGETVHVGDLQLDPYPVPHDAAAPVAFVISHGAKKIGHAADLGEVTPHIQEKLRDTDVLLIEANHDVEMLNTGPYPWPLKRRIKSSLGHLSNEDCARLLTTVNASRLQMVVLMHLSEQNNHPEIARITAAQSFNGRSVPTFLSSQGQPTELFSIQ